MQTGKGAPVNEFARKNALHFGYWAVANPNPDDTLPKVPDDMKVWFPSSFTPNGDGLNDDFIGSGENVISIEIQVFNLRGDEVFHCYDFNTAWDGEYLGNHATAGAYLWKARATGYINHKKVVNNYHGIVELIR